MRTGRRTAVLCLCAAALLLAAAGALAGIRQPDRAEGTSRSLPALAAAAPVPRQSGWVDVNGGNVQELSELPGIGETLAQAIIDEREARGPFRYPEDLTSVRGIGEKKLAGFREMLDLTGEAPED